MSGQFLGEQMPLHSNKLIGLFAMLKDINEIYFSRWKNEQSGVLLWKCDILRQEIDSFHIWDEIWYKIFLKHYLFFILNVSEMLLTIICIRLIAELIHAFLLEPYSYSCISVY